MKRIVLSLVGSLIVGATAPTLADIRITEVAPWSSGNSPVGADWFEVTNTGASAVNISGWRVDDSSASFAASLPLTGINSISALESVVFVETSPTVDASARQAAFLNTWFGGSGPAGLRFGFYQGSGIGLSTDGDSVVLFDTSEAVRARVDFATSDGVAPFQTFDNAAGLNGTTITQLSSVGVNGAFLAAAGNEIGSPGVIAAIPEPETYALMLLGLGMVGAAVRRRRG